MSNIHRLGKSFRFISMSFNDGSLWFYGQAETKKEIKILKKRGYSEHETLFGLVYRKIIR